MLAILKRELKNYYTSLFAYIYYALFFLVTGIFFVLNCLDTYSTQFGYYVLEFSFYVMVIILPFCTMKLFAMERKYGTDQLLFTTRVSSFSVLFAKYLATLIFVFVPLALSIIFPIFISMHGTMSVSFVVSAYIGCALCVLVLLTIGMFISTLTTNLVLAVVISYGVYLVTLLSRIIEAIVTSDGLYNILHEYSVYNKFNDMVSGIVRSGDVIYLIVLTVMFFVLTWIVLESRRQSLYKMIGYGVVVVLCSFGICMFAMKYTKVYDFTAEKILTFSDATQEVVSGIDKETQIYYMGEQSRADATYQEFLNEYAKLNDNITVHYKNVSEDEEFRLLYLSDVSTVNESSLLVTTDERSIYLDSANYISTSRQSAFSTESELELEAQLTSAIYYTNSGEADKVYEIVGHSEESLNNEFSNLLALNNYEIEEYNLPESLYSIKDVLSDECKAVIINAPQTDYTEDEIAVLESYLEDGGNVFVIIDPLNEDTTNLFVFLKKYGLEVQSGVIIEQEENFYAYGTQYYLIPKLQKTDYTSEIIDKDLVLLSMTSKGILPDGSGNGYTSTDILMTSPKAYSKVGDLENYTTKSEEDISGPFSVASCASNAEEGNVFLLTSNVFFNEQADQESGGSNRKFFLEIMKQLTNTESTIWVEGKIVGDQVALYSYSSRNVIKVIVTIVIPFCILVFGVIIIMIRRTDFRFKQLKKRNDHEGEQTEQEEEA